MHTDNGGGNGRFVERLKGLTLDRQTDAVFMVDNDDNLTYLNRATRQLFGCAAGKSLLKYDDLLAALSNPETLRELIHEARDGKSHYRQCTLLPDGREVLGMLRVTPVFHAGACSHVVVSFHDDTRYQRLQRRLEQDEFIDRSTGLYNRKTLEIMFSMEIEKAERDPGQSHLAAMMIRINNLDHFRAVYDEATINLIMEHVGTSVRKSLRTNDIVFRYDENRLLAIITQFGWKSDLLIMAQRIEDNIAIPFHPRDNDIHLRAGIGISVFPDDGNTSDQLLANSVAALNETGADAHFVQMFNKEIHRTALDRLAIRSGLSTAVLENQLELYYMPIVDKRRKVVGVEALIRWNHPERGLLSPDAFLPVAIHSRIIGGISRWVMYRAQQDYRNWFAVSDIFLTFNLSAKDFADRFLIEGIDSSLAGGVKSSRLKIEITESELMEDIDLSNAMMEQLKQRGIGIFIDDFGVGQSSLTYLHDIQAECIKLDHSFMMRIEGPGREYDFMEAAVRLCKVLDRKVLLEGVETETQFELFRNCGADYFQGFLFGKPMPASELAHGCLM